MVAVLTKKGLKPADLRDFISVGFPVHYQLFESSADSLISKACGVSKAEARRKIKQNGVTFGEDKSTDPKERIPVGNVAVVVYMGKQASSLIYPVKAIYEE